MSRIVEPPPAGAVGARDQPEIDPRAPQRQPDPAPAWAGPLSGLVAAAAAICVALLVAAVMEVRSPLDAIGSEFIDHTPMWLKDWAIAQFGTGDKAALQAGMLLTIGVLSLAVGWAARRHRWVGALAIGAFGVLGAVVAAGRPDASASWAVPPLAGAAAGGALLRHLGALLARHDPARARPGRSRVPEGWDRRRFLATSGSAAGAAAIAGLGARVLDRRRADRLDSQVPTSLPPVADRASPGASSVPEPAAAGELGTPTAVEARFGIPASATVSPVTTFLTPNDDFYRIDTALSFPRTSLGDWRLSIGGMVANPLTLSYDDLLARPQIERPITIACVSNDVGGSLIGTAVWQGVRLADLLEEAGVEPGAQQVFGTSLDGWTCGFPVEAALDGRDAMIAIGMNGEPLPVRHGFPARAIVPGLYGYVSATKWLERIELTTWDDRVGYWVPRGWAREAPIKTQSRIDVPRRDDDLRAGPVVIAGVAWAQRRGIAKVEVRVDDGAWREAALASDVSVDTWRQWRVEWDATPGEHAIQVRATDGAGETQTDAVSRPDPDGATGWHTRRVTVAG